MNLSRLAVGFLGAVEIAEEHVLSVMKLSAGSPMAFWHHVFCWIVGRQQTVSGELASIQISRPILFQHSRRDEPPTRIGRLSGSCGIFLIVEHHLQRNELHLELCDRSSGIGMIADDDAMLNHVSCWIVGRQLTVSGELVSIYRGRCLDRWLDRRLKLVGQSCGSIPDVMNHRLGLVGSQNEVFCLIVGRQLTVSGELASIYRGRCPDRWLDRRLKLVGQSCASIPEVMSHRLAIGRLAELRLLLASRPATDRQRRTVDNLSDCLRGRDRDAFFPNLTASHQLMECERFSTDLKNGFGEADNPASKRFIGGPSHYEPVAAVRCCLLVISPLYCPELIYTYLPIRTGAHSNCGPSPVRWNRRHDRGSRLVQVRGYDRSGCAGEPVEEDRFGWEVVLEEFQPKPDNFTTLLGRRHPPGPLRRAGPHTGLSLAEEPESRSNSYLARKCRGEEGPRGLSEDTDGVIDQRRKKDSEDLPPARSPKDSFLDFKPQARCKESLV
ncbi:hypothetical protein GEV33_003633 [Tenebrio molitor]|uniref:Uncharacterized protein n=1 Tax=Tenebrio molitor TaxID=7067 RepID=A0A8J6LHF5_TENMO|nr:hypothetical protein GEV33_003633 [Tenebrio molitor]